MSESKNLKLIITGSSALRKVRIEGAGLINRVFGKILVEEGFTLSEKQKETNLKLVATRPSVVNKDFVAKLREKLINVRADLTQEHEGSGDPWEFE